MSRLYARQAITTKYHPATRRISATAEAGRIFIDVDDRLGVEANHVAAAQAFVAKWKWPGTYAMGALHGFGTTSYVFVNTEHGPSFKQEANE